MPAWSRAGWQSKGRAGTWVAFMVGAAFMGAIAFMTASMPGEAGKTLGSTWETMDIGYYADPQLAEYTDTGMAQWASSSAIRPFAGGSQIKVVFGPLLPPITHPGQSAQANLSYYSGRISGCEVRVQPDLFLALNTFGRQNVITHELGHCFGLDHSDKEGVMMNPRFYGFSNDDAATIAQLYPPPVVAPAVQQPTTEAPAQAPAPAAAQAAANVEAEPLGPPIVLSAAIVAAAASPRNFNGQLETGWNYVRWSGLESHPSACGCTSALVFDGSSWQRWDKTNVDWANELRVLAPGRSYWFLKP